MIQLIFFTNENIRQIPLSEGNYFSERMEMKNGKEQKKKICA